MAWGDADSAQSMQQVISSNSTLVYKSIVPLFLVALSVFLLFTLLYYPTQYYLDGMIVTLMTVGVTVYFCWFGVRLKQVRIDDDNFYVAGLFKEIAIPLIGINSVGGFQNGSLVILYLKEKSEFGSTIFFTAKWYPVFPWEAHPIFTQLGQLIREKQNS